MARRLLGVFLIVFGAALMYSLAAVWPAVQSAAAGKPPATISWFTAHYRPDADTAFLILVLLASSLGSYVHAATSFSDYVGNRSLAASWLWWYLLRGLVGTSLALLFYFALRGGYLGADTAAQLNPYGVAAVAGLVGLFSKQATDKLREIFDTAFRVAPGYGDDARSNGLAEVRPRAEHSAPRHGMSLSTAAPSRPGGADDTSKPITSGQD